MTKPTKRGKVSGRSKTHGALGRNQRQAVAEIGRLVGSVRWDLSKYRMRAVSRLWLCGILGGCAWLSGAYAEGADAATVPIEEATMTFILTSSAFQEGGSIPSLHTCEGQDLSPPLAWTDPPAGTKSFALINDDPDAPGRTWVHWVLYNLPPSLRRLPASVPLDQELPDGSRQGMTDFGRIGYGGPCPPSGTHRYFFKLYALDTPLALAPGATKRQLEQAMQDHILANAQLMGTYRRTSR